MLCLRILDITSLRYIYIYILNLDFGTLKPNNIFPIYVSAQKWSKVGTTGPNYTKWIEVDQIDKIGPNGNKVDRSGLKWTK